MAASNSAGVSVGRISAMVCCFEIGAWDFFGVCPPSAVRPGDPNAAQFYHRRKGATRETYCYGGREFWDLELLWCLVVGARFFPCLFVPQRVNRIQLRTFPRGIET